jgi:hypothetical protein
MSDPWGVPQNDQSGAQQQPVPPQPGQPYAGQPGAYPDSGAYPAPGAYPPAEGGGYAGAPGYPGAVPGPYGYQSVPAKPTNGIALAGAITSFVPVVGLVLSIIGAVRSRALGGAGKTAGTVGIVLSLLFTGGWGFLGYKLGNSTLADPGCISAEAHARALDSTLSSDEATLKADSGSGDTDQVHSDWQKLISDMSSGQADLEADAAKARHASVRDAIEKLNTDISTFVSEGQQYLAGDDSAPDSMVQTAEAMETDGDAVDSICGDATNG